MKVYIHEKGVIFVGKAWEIKQKLSEYRHQFMTIQEFMKAKNTNLK